MKHLIFLPLLLFTFNGFTQQKEKEQNTVDLTKVTILEPGIAHEFAVGRNQTVFARVGVTATFDDPDIYSSSNFGKVLFRGFLSGSYRAYYNFEKRRLKGKNTARNTANYFALLTIIESSPFNKPTYDMNLNNPFFTAGVVWGLQRNGDSRFSFDFNIGLGYAKIGTVSSVTLLGELNIGFWLGKKSSK